MRLWWAYAINAAGQIVGAGDFGEVRWVLNADGSIQVAYSKDGGAEQVSSVSAANTLAAAWDEPQLQVICADNQGAAEVAEVGRVAISADPAATLAELQALF